MAVVSFNPAEFVERYPEWNKVSNAQLIMYFERACMFLDNSDNSIVQDVCERKLLLELLVCHFATLVSRGVGATGSLTSATEGSVSASYTPLFSGGHNREAWFLQTQCGATFWQLIRKYILGGRWHEYHGGHRF